MLLVNWFTANLLMVLTVLVLIGIPLFITLYAFGKKTGAEADKEAYKKKIEEEKEKKEPLLP